MTGDHNKARQWCSQLGSETATKDVPLPQEVENFLESGSSFLDKRREYIKKTAAEAAKKERELKRVRPLLSPFIRSHLDASLRNWLSPPRRPRRPPKYVPNPFPYVPIPKY
jgi:hypothetical protein